MISGFIESPIGYVIIQEQDNAICAIEFSEDSPQEQNYSALLDCAKEELELYFKGQLRQFSFPIKQEGTIFQQQVWQTLTTLNFAEVISYTTLAIRMQNLAAIRAIASTNGKNKIMIAVPCHRIIGMTGDMTGYAGGIWRKQWLLEHEAKVAGIGQSKLSF